MGWHAPPPDLQLDNPLWQSALTLWDTPGFASACLEAQHRGIAVSHILVALYSAACGLNWDGAEPAPIREWRRNATETLRALRQRLDRDNPAVATLRRNLGETELTSEQLELAWWWERLGAPETGVSKPDEATTNRALAHLGLIGLDSRHEAIRDSVVQAWQQANEHPQ